MVNRLVGAATTLAALMGLVIGLRIGTPESADANDVIADSRWGPAVLPPARECERANPSWLFCDDFEQDRLRSYFERTSVDSSFERDSGTGIRGSIAMRATFRRGQVGAGALHLAIGRTPHAYMRPVGDSARNHRQVYWRFFVRYDTGWIGGTGDKLTRAIVFASPANWAQAAVGHAWAGRSVSGGADRVVLDPVRGTSAEGVLLTKAYNDFANFEWLGAITSRSTVASPREVGSWQCLEFHMQLNDPGQANGQFRFFLNEVEQASHTSLNWLGSFSTYGINAIYLENNWGVGAPQDQRRYFDNFVVSQAPIGCS